MIVKINLCYAKIVLIFSIKRLALESWEGLAMDFNAIKVFSATKAKEREELGEVITKWIAANPAVQITNSNVLQSSDNEYHCLTIIIYYKK